MFLVAIHIRIYSACFVIKTIGIVNVLQIQRGTFNSVSVWDMNAAFLYECTMFGSNMEFDAQSIRSDCCAKWQSIDVKLIVSLYVQVNGHCKRLTTTGITMSN